MTHIPPFNGDRRSRGFATLSRIQNQRFVNIFLLWKRRPYSACNRTYSGMASPCALKAKFMHSHRMIHRDLLRDSVSCARQTRDDKVIATPCLDVCRGSFRGRLPISVIMVPRAPHPPPLPAEGNEDRRDIPSGCTERLLNLSHRKRTVTSRRWQVGKPGLKLRAERRVGWVLRPIGSEGSQSIAF